MYLINQIINYFPLGPRMGQTQPTSNLYQPIPNPTLSSSISTRDDHGGRPRSAAPWPPSRQGRVDIDVRPTMWLMDGCTALLANSRASNITASCSLVLLARRANRFAPCSRLPRRRCTDRPCIQLSPPETRPGRLQDYNGNGLSGDVHTPDCTTRTYTYSYGLLTWLISRRIGRCSSSLISSAGHRCSSQPHLSPLGEGCRTRRSSLALGVSLV